jgi:hypothetical protein
VNENPSVGLFLSRNKAVAVWVSAGSEPAVLHTMNITPAEDELSTIAVQAARAAARAARSLMIIIRWKAPSNLTPKRPPRPTP